METTASSTCGCEGCRDGASCGGARGAGLPYRMEAHREVIARMHRRLRESLPEATFALGPPGEVDDVAAGLMDAWATMAEVLSFYQERVVAEGYLRTATEDRSLEALARMVGHDPRPPSSASAWLAVTTDDAVAGGEARVDAGTQVQSVPPPGEEPQVFEVARDTAVRPTWNALRPRLRLPPPRLMVHGDALVVSDRVGNAWVPRPQALSELFVEPGKAPLEPGGTILFMAWQVHLVAGVPVERMEGAAVRIKSVATRDDGTRQVTLDAVTLTQQEQRL